MNKIKLPKNLVVIIHGLLTIYIFVSLCLVFIPNFYDTHLVAHIIWTVEILATFIINYIYKDCPLTILEKNHLEKDAKDTYGKSFILHWVHKLTGIKIPFVIFDKGKYVYGIIVLLSWL